MKKIDTKDKKILQHLNQNSRESLSQIGKKVGLPKSVVVYRVNRLIKDRVIKNFYTVIDTHKLGYIILRFYFKYQYTTPAIKGEIIDYFKKCKFCGIINTTEGAYDLGVYMFIKNLPEFQLFWQQTLEKYRNYLTKQKLSFYFQEYIYGPSFLENKNNIQKQVEVFGDLSKLNIDKKDLKILYLLGPNARIPTKDIAQKLNLTSITVANRIKKMIDQKIILGFRTNIDNIKIGKRIYKIDITLKEYKKLQAIINYVKDNPNLYCIDRTLGYVDLEIAFSFNNVSQVHKIMEDISKKFPDSVKDYHYLSVIETQKMNYIPSG